MNDAYYRGNYRIAATRLSTYDYRASGIYFVTICTQARVCYFGDIVDDGTQCRLRPTPLGQQAVDCWQAIPDHFPFVLVDEFQVMPNHIHGLLCIDKPDVDTWQTNQFGPQRQNLASIVRGYKIGITKFARQHNLSFGWQARYHDRIVRSTDELQRIRHYIVQNPARWHHDKENPSGLLM